MRHSLTYIGVVTGQLRLFVSFVCAVLLCNNSLPASEVAQLAQELSAKRSPPYAVAAALLARVRAAQSHRQADALRGYIEVLDYVRTTHGEALSAQQVYEQIVVPGIELGERLRTAEMTPTQKRQLGRLYFAKGQHLFRAPHVGREVAQQGYHAYQQALALEEDQQAPHRAECLYRRDVALMILGRSNLDQFEADARSAARIEPKHAGAHFLLGYVDYARQKTTEGAMPRFRLLQNAAEEFTRAIDLLREQEDFFNELACYYEYRVNVWIQLSEFYTDERTRYLQNAADDAGEAVRRGPSNVANAHAMLGTALETLAGLNDRARLGQALAAFRGAAAASPKTARYWIAQGRCECKLAALEPEGAAAHAVAALEHLKQAVPASVPSVTDAERAELHYWRGRAYLLDPRQDELAEKAFADSIAAAGDKTETWVALALEQSAFLALDRAEKLLDPASPELNVYLQRARGRADALTPFKHKHRVIARIRGKAFELEGKPLEALALYDAELAREDKAQEVTDRQLALIRLDLMFNEKWRPALQQQRKRNASLEPAKTSLGGL